LTSTTSAHSINDNAQIKTLQDRALAAEKRANHSSNQLALLEAKLAELQSKSGKAEDKWEARVREYENRLRIAGEKIKTEKQGGKERALQLEGQVRWVISSASFFPLPCSKVSRIWTHPLLFRGPDHAVNSADLQRAGTTGRFGEKTQYESRGYSSDSFAFDALKLRNGQ